MRAMFFKKKSFQLLLLVFALMLTGLNAQVITTFTPVYQTTQKGGIVYLANSSMGCSANPPLVALSATCAAGTTVVPPGGTLRDNNFISAFIDIDGDGTTYMSSSDSLALPPCSQISKALLFWGASGAATASFTTCKMKVNTGSYQTITAAASQTNNTGFSTYHCYADVTTLLQSGGINCRVTVANVNSSVVGTSNTFGSWCIAVVYKNDLKTMRQLTVFKGLANVSAGSVNVPISGFLTPLTGPVSLEVGLYVHDGDRASVGDALNFKGAAAFLPISDAVNPANDVMNSTVSYAGTLTPFRTPNMNNTSGLDADIFIPNNTLKTFIGNAATSATFQMTTGGETYLTQMVTTAIDVYEPDLRSSISARDVNGGLLVPGDIVEYRVKGVNIGSDPSINTFITDTLDLRANYIPNSCKVVFGAITGTMTDASGDDIVDYNAAARTLKFRIGTGATSAIGGTVQNSPAGIDSTIVTYSVMCTNSCVKIACSPSIQARCFIWGTGATSSNVYNNGSNPGIFDAFGCPIPGTTSSPITATACTAPVATNNGPGCIGASIILSAPTDTDVVYNWSGPNTYTSSLQNPTLSALTTSMAGTYTVTLSIPSSTCNAILSTSFSVGICNPNAVNDASTALQNNPTSGNLASNDGNLISPAFSITTQPSNGTITVNATTGQYTFAPAPTFTGVTTGTYAVCNGTNCSSASVSFTVFPPISANPNVISTTPTSSTTGNVLTNDGGNATAIGATYSVVASTVPPANGTIAINPTTGQYTFTPNPAFVGTVQTTYTVCNTAVSPQQCSTTSITISVFPVPVAVNDATNTVINTTVTGNASSNDTGTTSAQYSITAQPSNGTIAINVATGQYTFTPVSSFTGVTTGTYQICNGLGANCSTAAISVTVHPQLTANPDAITTTPTSNITGSLASNDAGITSTIGATYNFTATALAPTTGTLTLNPATGQYSFTPNPAFVGTVQTTYTVCNTALNPQQCSNSTITLNVFPVPTAVNDGTTSVINTSVSGNASSNDTGTASAQYSITAQPASGTLAINATTGQYTFTPAPSFTGITSGTYQICNGLGVNCSTAAISVTVHPQLTANPDVISTTPTSSVTGSLATNDAGITSTLGATYNYTATALAPTTGTLTLNPATGQYSFTPNPAFVGTVQTTYTVCNTAVNPQQCSNSTITLNVFPIPTAVSDATTSVINTSVTGNASTNDSGTSGGQFSITAQPANGTLTINASTGQYTFTPSPSFTGVTSGTYQVCNGLGANCSTAAITVTVYPALIANPDNILTLPTSTAGGNLSTNDTGITSTLGATYNFSASAPSPATGTLVLNPSTGQYTFTPNPSFNGSVQTTYTVCNTAVNPIVCSTSSITISVFSSPQPANDANTTILNTPVSGNAASNDVGIAGATFSIIAQGAGGTMTIDPNTGQYTFTPNASFTGVSSSTYQVCSVALSTCSTAIITVTVHPLIVANADVISTTPGTNQSGNLLGNDAGITSTLGATYSVSVTQPAAATGTIQINPATGQYTFVPNPSFTGSIQTTYTVCNTAVTAAQCSSSIITIQVYPVPVAVNDQNSTLINSNVSGNLSSNDTGTASAIYSIVAQPSGGIVTVNSSTGQYTFSPAPKFTGVTTATYQLCNGAGLNCSNAVITLSVYPALAPGTDTMVALPNGTVTGSMASNDAGVLLTGSLIGTYQYTVSPLNPTVGLITYNPANGQYTFVPASGFTGTAVTTYTVCNNSLSPVICNTANIVVVVSPSPSAFADNNTTMLNTPVTGTVATNDVGALSVYSPVFTNSQPLPGTGSLNMDPSNGSYTFIPATGFTGTTSATYTLCNLVSPPCSTTTITFSVYPVLVSSPDVINASPTSSVSGSLAGNDSGVLMSGTLTANYSVTVTQPSPSTGSIVLNPATGQYTFIPSGSFTGSTQITYTICNISVNPQVCSTNTIVINVFPDPSPVNDATTTVANTTVVANASTNDTGTTGGTYSILSQGAGGTVTIDPATGQYTFVPAPSFTGVTTATYNLCNGAPVTCSTAVITITVYPILQANDDVVNVSPGNTTSGSLLGNDDGILAGGNYSVTVSPLPASTGTLLLNPATGQYTFIPNPSFTGSTQTTYTVCNNSVNPQVCSTATIVINSRPDPAPVDDATVTISGNPVSGFVSTNDGGVSGGTFSIIAQPIGGTVTIDPATGGYTFVPAPSFTGVTTATYVLCNGAPITCSTAVLTITVYPILTAVNDQTVTNINTPVSGTVLTNDNGIVNGGTYSVTASPIVSSTGTLTVNPSTGQYTFTPATGFTGTVSATYTVCQYQGTVSLQCSTATLVINVGAKSSIGIAKRLASTKYNSDGTVELNYKFVVKNMGNQALSNVSLIDDLATVFPSPASFTIISLPTIVGNTSQLSLDVGYDGISNTNMLVPTSSSLAIGKTDTLSLTVKVKPGNQNGTFSNSASVTAVGGGTTTSDVSADGDNPDPDNDGNPDNNNGVSTFSYSAVNLGLAKSAGPSTSVGSGCYEVTFRFTVKNYGTQPVYNIKLEDDLANTFAQANSYQVVSGPTCANGNLIPNQNYTGAGTQVNLLSNTSTLAAGAVDTVVVKVNYCVTGSASFTNTALVSGSSLPTGGFVGSDVSTDGNDPDPNTDGSPSESQPTEFAPESEIFVPNGFSPNNDGVNDVFVVRGIQNFPNTEVSILNRWGNVVYKKKQYDNTWDGTSNQGVSFGGNQLPEGTYFYIIDLGDGKKPLKGYVYLNRSAK